MKGNASILLVDAGNTRIKFGWLRRGQNRRSPDTLALSHAELSQLPQWLTQLPSMPDAALGVCVASEAVATLIEHTLQPSITMHWLRSSAYAAGVMNLYDHPEQLGNDRWIALIGLGGHTRSAALLASFGTATTVDTLGPLSAAEHAPLSDLDEQTESRRFEGGLILPGPELMRQSLANGTAGLPYAQGASVAFPRNTHTAISSGIAAAQAGAVIRQWRYALDTLGVAPTVYCSGGGWPLVADEVEAALRRAQADNGLPPSAPHWLDAPVLDGLAALAGQTLP